MEHYPVNLLWTGGWDSTFQLLRLLLVHGVSVEPIYLIDSTRGSLDIEVQTMERIRDALAQSHPQTRTLLLSTRYGDVDALQPDADITAAWQRIRRKQPLGSQYEWVARFLRQHGLCEVEMGTEFTHHGASGLLMGRTSPSLSRLGYATHRLTPEARSSDIGALFGRLTFPLARIDKYTMHKEAEWRGWSSLLAMTWFCHSPLFGKPCGMCNPCRGVIGDGFGWRIPATRRALGSVHRATIGASKDAMLRASRWWGARSAGALIQ